MIILFISLTAIDEFMINTDKWKFIYLIITPICSMLKVFLAIKQGNNAVLKRSLRHRSSADRIDSYHIGNDFVEIFLQYFTES